MARNQQSIEDFRVQFLAPQVAAIRQHATAALAEIRQAGIETKHLVPFPLDRMERVAVAGLTGLSAELRTKLAGRGGKFAAAEVLATVFAVADSVLAAEPAAQDTLLFAARKLMYGVHMDILRPLWRARARRTKPTSLLYQLKITLIGIEPAVWRRIQVKDCTLDKLHEYLQTVMGWTNSHLNEFQIDGQRYGDPELMEENFAEMNYRDSTITLLSSVLSADGKRFEFRYTYDFGDGWQHEVLFEGCPGFEKGQKYPLCVEGEHACPPEDVGGVHGYAEFLRTINSGEHTNRVEMLEWADGWFDPDEFDATTATKSMWKGLPDWRNTA